MSNRFVRASKYRHVFGRPTKKEQCYDNLRVSRNAWDTNLIKVNPSYIAVNWESAGGGAFAVIPLEERGRLPDLLLLFRGHTAVVLDTDWNPFDDSVLASGSDDGKAFIWKVPAGFSTHVPEGAEIQDVAPVAKLTGHSRKVGHVLFNPAAADVLATSSGDYTVKVWDVESQTPKLTLKHGEVIQSLSWSANGAYLVTTSRDKKLRIWDVRQEKPAHEGPGHLGAKNSRAVWMGEHERIATTGFSKMSDRQLGLWDIRAAGEPVDGFTRLDAISGVCMPFWDDSTSCLYLAGKGDGNIRYYEYEDGKFEYLSEYKSADPQRGVAFLPKRGVSLHENEVVRAYKTVNDTYIEPISFIVPRRSEVFQNDIYPPVVGTKPGTSASEWFGGKDALPPKINLENLFDGQAAQEVKSENKPMQPLETSKAATPTTSAPAPTPREPPAAALRSPPPSMKEQTASISNMASKFADTAEDEEEDDTSSFEEVVKPVERSLPASISPIKTVRSEPIPSSSSTTQSPTKAVSSSTSDMTDLQAKFDQIAKLVESQERLIEAQNKVSASLRSEIDLLKSQLKRA